VKQATSSPRPGAQARVCWPFCQVALHPHASVLILASVVVDRSARHVSCPTPSRTPGARMHQSTCRTVAAARQRRTCVVGWSPTCRAAPKRRESERRRAFLVRVVVLSARFARASPCLVAPKRNSAAVAIAAAATASLPPLVRVAFFSSCSASRCSLKQCRRRYPGLARASPRRQVAAADRRSICRRRSPAPPPVCPTVETEL
jgi:hypothetical protein